MKSSVVGVQHAEPLRNPYEKPITKNIICQTQNEDAVRIPSAYRDTIIHNPARILSQWSRISARIYLARS